MSLATKYRPKEFEDTCSQTSIIRILQRQLETHNVKNAYLFSGISGCGKTTVARIFANKINNGKGTPIEIDAASNNGVDYMREVVKSAKERALDCMYKVIIVDECHTLTSQSWQSLLKVIEETPKYTIFIFCTTDPQKIPDTIQNRCLRFNFTRIPAVEIEQRLNFICEQEGFTNYTDSTQYIARVCKGQLRNAITMLEKVSDYSSTMSIENTLTAIGGIYFDTFFRVQNAIIDGNESALFREFDQLTNNSVDFKLFVDEYISFILDVIKYYLFKEFSIISIPASFEKELTYITAFENVTSYYDYCLEKLMGLKNMLKGDSAVPQTVLVTLLQMCRCK